MLCACISRSVRIGIERRSEFPVKAYVSYMRAVHQAFCLFFPSHDVATHLKTSDGTYQLLCELPHFCSKNRHFVCAVAARAKFSWISPEK